MKYRTFFASVALLISPFFILAAPASVTLTPSANTIASGESVEFDIDISGADRYELIFRCPAQITLASGAVCRDKISQDGAGSFHIGPLVFSNMVRVALSVNATLRAYQGNRLVGFDTARVMIGGIGIEKFSAPREVISNTPTELSISAPKAQKLILEVRCPFGIIVTSSDGNICHIRQTIPSDTTSYSFVVSGSKKGAIIALLSAYTSGGTLVDHKVAVIRIVR